LNAAGCDSVATLALAIKNSSSSLTTLSACDSLVWNGITYKTSGTYTYSTLNAVGCDSIASLVLTIHSSPSAPGLSITQPTCAVSTGIITVTVFSAGDNYSFDNGVSYGGNNISGPLVTGSYFVKVRSAAGCESPAQVANIVNQPNPLTVLLNSSKLLCPESTDGTITITPIGGSYPYTYSINNGLTSQSDSVFNNLAAGIYPVKITGHNGCTKDSSVTVGVELAFWTGTISSDWHTAGNWSTGNVPTGSTHVIIPAGTVNPCVIGNADAHAASVHQKSGSVLQITNNHQLIIDGKCGVLPAGRVNN
jgi:hypothetical protein